VFWTHSIAQLLILYTESLYGFIKSSRPFFIKISFCPNGERKLRASCSFFPLDIVLSSNDLQQDGMSKKDNFLELIELLNLKF
jgi:hypothetical protein